ncbi:cellulose biosynthesis protein BcsD [Pseudoroseomonas cervicalis]|uniref:cellulose biosynthesis protein BcsD n=1 Tax=Teichococcus cervicalis TaxID=204525 RepID=UPI0027884282|nr:cellulose biosynthesis protein BcsD [Pseudoroseomonas cervicalis]MDQ1081655.1 hypothetical protein [Pseudoroseomonas cervicalis]
MQGTPGSDAAMLAYLARRGTSAQWRGFLRALVETLDGSLDRAGRDALLRAVGGRLGATLPLGPADTLASLEARMNEALAGLEWGFVGIGVDEADRSLRLTHHAMPAVPLPADESGHWFGAVLEGLYGAWMTAQQGGATGGATMRVVQSDTARLVLRYGS